MICVFINTNPSFKKNSAVIVSEIDNFNKFALITTASIERDFRSEYLFRTCSVATSLVTSLEFHSDLCEYAVPFLTNYGKVPYSLIFNPIAALLQAVLQKNTEPFRNSSGRNEEQDCINVSKRCTVRPDVHNSLKS